MRRKVSEAKEKNGHNGELQNESGSVKPKPPKKQVLQYVEKKKEPEPVKNAPEEMQVKNEPSPAISPAIESKVEVEKAIEQPPPQDNQPLLPQNVVPMMTQNPPSEGFNGPSVPMPYPYQYAYPFPYPPSGYSPMNFGYQYPFDPAYFSMYGIPQVMNAQLYYSNYFANFSNGQRGPVMKPMETPTSISSLPRTRERRALPIIDPVTMEETKIDVKPREVLSDSPRPREGLNGSL